MLEFLVLSGVFGFLVFHVMQCRCGYVGFGKDFLEFVNIFKNKHSIVFVFAAFLGGGPNLEYYRKGVACTAWDAAVDAYNLGRFESLFRQYDVRPGAGALGAQPAAQNAAAAFAAQPPPRPAPPVNLAWAGGGGKGFGGGKGAWGGNQGAFGGGQGAFGGGKGAYGGKNAFGGGGGGCYYYKGKGAFGGDGGGKNAFGGGGGWGKGKGQEAHFFPPWFDPNDDYYMYM